MLEKSGLTNDAGSTRHFTQYDLIHNDHLTNSPILAMIFNGVVEVTMNINSLSKKAKKNTPEP